MSLEKSILTESVIGNLLSTHYGIIPLSVNKLKLGTANCFRVYDGTKYYFLKEFQSDSLEDEVVREAKLLDYLSDAEFPVTRFYKADNNEFVIKYQNHILCLEEYIEGHTYGYNDLPLELLPKVGRMLGKLHQALKDYVLPVGMSEEWLTSISADSVIAKYDELIQLADSKAAADKLPQLMEDFRYKKQLAVRCEEYKKYYNGITYCGTHGDFQGCQLIWEQDEIKAVIDFSAAACLPVTWEIMRSFVQSSNLCRNSATIDIPALCDYVREYLKFSPLTKNDMIAMPYVYLFQLAQSRYGYPQYLLNTDSEDREGLQHFAFWRTRMCREVERKAEEISEVLVKLL